MREILTYGSARGAARKGGSYRDKRNGEWRIQNGESGVAVRARISGMGNAG